MLFPKYAGLAWFGHGRLSDPHYLATWRNAPLTYKRGQELDWNWNFDHYEVALGIDETGELFKRAVELILTDQLHPTAVMTASSHFKMEKRAVQVGDRVLQRIRLFEIANRPVLEALAMNEVTEVIQEERKAGFTYTTTAVHSETGEWTSTVEWRDTGEVVLVMDITSRTRPGTPRAISDYSRRIQLHGHDLSVFHLTKLLDAGPRREIQDHFSTEVLPSVVLVSIFLSMIAAGLGFYYRSRKS